MLRIQTTKKKRVLALHEDPTLKFKEKNYTKVKTFPIGLFLFSLRAIECFVHVFIVISYIRGLRKRETERVGVCGV